MDSKDDQKQITKLINTLMLQSRVIKLKLSLCQKYMVFVLLEEKRKCLTEIQTVTDFYCYSNRRVASIVERTSILTISVIWGNAANHCCQRQGLSVCITHTNFQKQSRGWNRTRDLLSPSVLFCIQSASYKKKKPKIHTYCFHILKHKKKRIHVSLKRWRCLSLLWMNFPVIFLLIRQNWAVSSDNVPQHMVDVFNFHQSNIKSLG